MSCTSVNHRDMILAGRANDANNIWTSGAGADQATLHEVRVETTPEEQKPPVSFQIL
jgi:hypothetical protein